MAERNDRRAGASTGAANINALLTSEVDKAVDKVVLGLEVGELLKGGKTAGQRSGEVKRLGAGDGDGLDLLSLDLFLAQSQRKLGSESGVASRDGEVSGITEVDVTIRRGN